MDIRVGIRQWWALTALAAADPVPLTVTAVRKAVRARRHGDPAKDVTDSLARKGLITCASPDGCSGRDHEHLLRLTHAGWASRMSQSARVEARAST